MCLRVCERERVCVGVKRSRKCFARKNVNKKAYIKGNYYVNFASIRIKVIQSVCLSIRPFVCLPVYLQG